MPTSITAKLISTTNPIKRVWKITQEMLLIRIWGCITLNIQRLILARDIAGTIIMSGTALTPANLAPIMRLPID